MKRIRQLLPRILPALLLLALPAGNAGAVLMDRGPVVPEVVGSSPPQHGFPLWYRDTNRVPMELCLSTAQSPTSPGTPMCTLLPGPTYDSALPLTYPTNFPDEIFWWTGDARVRVDGPLGRLQCDLIMAIEGTYATGAIIPGDQVNFARIRILMDTPVPGDYTVIHPYGQKTFFNLPAGADTVKYTEDIGLTPGGNFDGVLQGHIGPFLVWDSGAPINVGGELFVGDPAVDHTVTGSPTGNNFLRIIGPAGANLDGLGGNVVQTNLFALSGKLFAQSIPTPITVDKAVYARETGVGAYVTAFATTNPVANPTNALAPFPANYAPSGVPSSLTASGTGIPTRTMTTRAQADGKFFSSTGIFPDPGTFPATIRVTNTADVTPTSVDVPLTDEVLVSQATYRPASKTLTVAAASSDQIGAPSLQLYLPGMTIPVGTLSAGQVSVTFPVTDISVTPAKTYQIPPMTVTVRSAKGGEVTVPVVAQDVP